MQLLARTTPLSQQAPIAGSRSRAAAVPVITTRHAPPLPPSAVCNRHLRVCGAPPPSGRAAVSAQAQATPQDGGDANKAATDTSTSSSSGSEQAGSSPQQASAGGQQLGAAAAGAGDEAPAAQPAAPDASSPLPAADATAGGASSSGASVPKSGAAAAGSSSGGGGGSGGGSPSAVTLATRFTGVGYTFVLAGFLKIMTVGGLAATAPTDMARTAFGKASPYLMVPFGLAMAWGAKQVVDAGLHEDKRFMRYLLGGLVVLYFGLVKLMFRYEPRGEWVRRPKPRLPGQMADLRAELGDRELLAGGVDMDGGRSYRPERPGQQQLYDDMAWYEGRYPSQLDPKGSRRRGGGMSTRSAALAATDTEDDLAPGRGRGGGTAEPTVSVKPSGRRSFLSDGSSAR